VATGIGSVSSGGAESRHRCTTEADEWPSRRRQRQCVADDDDDDEEPDSTCSATGVAAMAETNVDRSSSTAYGRLAKNPAARPQLGQLAPEVRTTGRLLASSPGDASALEPPESSMVGGDSDSSLCGDLTPIRRSRFDVDEYPTAASRRLDAGRRQRQPRSTQVYSTAAQDRLRNRSVVYINMLAVSGGTGSGKDRTRIV